MLKVQTSTSERPEWWTSDHWSTPWTIIRRCEAEFGAFDLDPCCEVETAKAPRFFTPVEDGLRQHWFGRVWLNPPYSDPQPWLEKAIVETRANRASLVIALLPVATDTVWFHRCVKDVAKIRFIQGRVRFLGWHGTPIKAPKSPSMFAIYGPASNSSEGSMK